MEHVNYNKEGKEMKIWANLSSTGSPEVENKELNEILNDEVLLDSIVGGITTNGNCNGSNKRCDNTSDCTNSSNQVCNNTSTCRVPDIGISG